MFTEYNTEGYTPEELQEMTAELEQRLVGVSDTDDRNAIESNFNDEIARR